MPYKTPVFSSLEYAIQSLFGNTVHITHTATMSGGDIGINKKATLSDKTIIVIKEYTGTHASDMGKAEAYGLQCIARTHTLRTPQVHALIIEESPLHTVKILMEYMPISSPQHQFWEDFGHMLASMHSAPQAQLTQGSYFGLDRDNFIGTTPQINTPTSSWIDFFITNRIRYQSKLAAQHSYFSYHDMKQIEILCKKLPQLLPTPDFPSLLHGDLWSGNYLCSQQIPILIDPAVYYGHHEADLAMTELFGGYPHEFYDAYSEILTIGKEYHTRKYIYNLYHMLNHLNLFGRSYLGSVKRILSQVL